MNNEITQFFDKHVCRLHKEVDRGELCYLDLEIDKGRESYFSAPVHPEYLYLGNISFESEAKLEETLNQFWKDSPELLPLIPDLVRLAFKLKEENKEQSAELSPFVYAMF
jgi:hypothetical protein